MQNKNVLSNIKYALKFFFSNVGHNITTMRKVEVRLGHLESPNDPEGNVQL